MGIEAIGTPERDVERAHSTTFDLKSKQEIHASEPPAVAGGFFHVEYPPATAGGSDRMR
ncbi:MAG: hypothetical protein H7Y30_04205 [Pyrinomonadaceae bacterium]|nr:hypothetical protein [Pyrinomonadaceae bacterium]